jgi:tetratricopeptide (TPR) repeat protein
MAARKKPVRKTAAKKAKPRKQPVAKATPADRPVEGTPLLPPASGSGKTPPKFTLGVDPAKIDEAIKTMRSQVSKLLRRGFADKIRIKYRGKALGPDIPVAYFLAAEAVAFWTTGFLRILLVNLGAKALLEVELISSAVEHHAKGVERYLAGDLDAARKLFESAVESDDYHAASHRMLGTLLRIKGEGEEAKRHLKRAVELDPDGEEGKKAKELLDEMG